ncbi:DinB family protein [Pedobacter arcticus]|uniref:DinB family protein n=1 Tax=Pedobacter arcticus TaxID=752140 RepID=UPI0002EDC73A|nr:DinB family protein [Pedobacter arcticus]
METITNLLAKELEQEAATTRKMLSIVPNDKYSWKPHEKSMNIKSLATHIADLPSWPEMVLKTKELDFANNTHHIDDVDNTISLIQFFDRSVDKSLTALQNAKLETLDEMWVLRSGDQIFSEDTKYEVIRMSIAQQIHHRAQLGVYLRLLNIPIPGSYGPSADDQNF